MPTDEDRPMRIAQFTDLHLRRHVPGPGPRPRVRTSETAALLVEALTDARRRGAEVVALTGDLVDVPAYLRQSERDEPSDATLWREVRADYGWLVATLDRSGMPWMALPGRADSRRILCDELGPRPLVADVHGVRLIAFWDRVHDLGPQRVGVERRRFDAALEDPDTTPQVHLQHYPITPASAWGGYFEAPELRRRLAGCDRVKLVLSGHDHAGAPPVYDGAALFSVTPAFAEAPHSYRLFDVARDGAVTWEQIDMTTSRPRTPAVFLDRDGCINTLPAYRSGPEAMELLTGAANGIRRLRASGYRIVVITNQACVGLGYATPGVLAEVHDRMGALLAAEGAAVDAIYASYEAGPGAIDERFTTSELRKPLPTMLLQAASELHLDLSASFMIGDRESDVEAGRAAGVQPLLVRTGHGRDVELSWIGDSAQGGCPVVDDLAQAAEMIMAGQLDTDIRPPRPVAESLR